CGEQGFPSAQPYLNHTPAANATGLKWEHAFDKATSFVSQLTLEEKVGLVSGTEGPCVGNIIPIPRLNFTGLCIQNGPMALEQGTYVSVFPAGVTIAATWDKRIAYERGNQHAAEFRAKRSQIILGPVAGPLGRSALGGRNWEGFSPDPFLMGELFTETIVGTQDGGVQACAKHYIGNEQETQRQPSQSENGKTIESISSNIDDTTLHELYLWPFQQAVKAGVATVSELGFQGYVMFDWGATDTGPKAINSGEDMDMPGTSSFGPVYWGPNLTEAIKNGSVSTGRLDDMCHRVLTPYFYLNQDQGFPGVDPSSKDINALLFDGPETYENYNYTFPHTANVDVRGNHGDFIRKAAAEGTVLLKNVNYTLPLQSPKQIAVYDNDAGEFTNGMSFFYFDGVSNYEYGVLPAGEGSGSGLFSYVVSPLEAIKQRANFKKTLVQYLLNNTAIIEDNSPSMNALLPSPPDICLVFLKSWATEGKDRTTLLHDWLGAEVVEKVASKCANTVVVSHTGGINVMPWANHPNVTAILVAHLPGQEAGNSIVDVLWGDVNPSGHLPYTIAKKESDYSYAPIVNSTSLTNAEDPTAWQDDFKGGDLIDYHKLSAESLSAKTLPGGNPHLWDNLYRISTTVKNAGHTAGATVPQLYLNLPKLPSTNSQIQAKKVLRGFYKLHLKTGESKTVTFDLTRRDISRWDVVKQKWVIPEGKVQAWVGFSSRDLRAGGSFTQIPWFIASNAE
ncbi:hypothetical protein KD926_002944, partial [Aspergillus affinis]